MSAKDTADAILRDFRTSMADMAVYRFDTSENAQAVLGEIEHQDWLMADRSGRLLSLEVESAVERMLSI